MTQRRRRNRTKFFLTGVAVFAAVFAIGVIGLQWITKTGIFHIPGVVHYGDNLSASETSALQRIFTEEVVLDKDVAIDAYESDTRPEVTEGEYIYNIYVPVADFEDYRGDTGEFTEGEYEMLPLEELDFTHKLLSINGDYYLDTFNRGARYRVVKFESEKFKEEIEPLVEATFSKKWPEQGSVLTFAQTGVTALSRHMNEKLAAIGGDATFFGTEIKDFLRGFDLLHTSNESSFSSYATGENICSDMRFKDLLVDIGLDVVELTGNHNLDCGAEAARNTIDWYNEQNIKIVGGGKTATEAAEPLLLDEKGTGITFLAYNQSTGGATYDDTPGANQYYEENFLAEVAAAKERGDFVIVDIQYYECSAYASEYEDPTCDAADSAAGDQVGFFRHLIDMGADMVVGTSAHQSQTYELYGDGVIYYGLGNLFFDQAWWPGTTRSLVLAHYFYDGKLLQTKIVPTEYDGNYQTRVMPDSGWYLRRLLSVQP